MMYAGRVVTARILCHMHPLITAVLAALLTIGATARLVRLVTVDEFPPVVKVKTRVTVRFGIDHWLYQLLSCPWCAAPWVLAPVMGTALLWHEQLWWMLATAWLTGAYLVGMIVSRDA